MTSPRQHSLSNFGLLLRQVKDGLGRRLEHELTAGGYDLNLSQYVVMKHLAQRGEMTAIELARHLNHNPGAMTRLLDRLQARGWVERRPHGVDRRALLVSLTGDGRAMWEIVQVCGRRAIDAALGGLTAEENDALQRTLERIRDNLSGTP
ncbi:MarR family winged helix-turn-helix transcriptional regulator [Coralloluteibacterium stylophorae]|uniref:MarR family transcriptional regulator n=1 Tax=Coralloluteibacterium stylophorae TaxID=1776034 RepID=A0A8J7VUN8_9GAMM|nr:MarR family transcriptional regulator [Coralloluteibacterium stylophorae]MBS7456363.1 MarR family transcriptional regulator [Coralloluteibacterium stylophorae]